MCDSLSKRRFKTTQTALIGRGAVWFRLLVITVSCNCNCVTSRQPPLWLSVSSVFGGRNKHLAAVNDNDDFGWICTKFYECRTALSAVVECAPALRDAVLVHHGNRDANQHFYLVNGDQGCPSHGWDQGSRWVAREADTVQSIHHVGDLSYADLCAGSLQHSWLEHDLFTTDRTVTPLKFTDPFKRESCIGVVVVLGLAKVWS